MILYCHSRLPLDLEDLNDSKYQSMRIINKRTKNEYGWKHYRNYNKEIYQYLDNIIKSYIGKSFNECYSKICRKFSKKKYSELLKVFLNKFSKDFSVNSKYYVDDSNIIRRHLNNSPKSTEVIVKKSVSKPYYRVNTELLIQYPSFANFIIKSLGISVLFDILEGKIFYESQISKITKLKDTILRYLYSTNMSLKYTLDDFICLKKTDVVIVYKKRSKEYLRYNYELIDSIRKSRRDTKKLKKKEQSVLLGNLEKERKLRENNFNIITRNRLGFCEESFKGEFYHGQKRKKRK